MTQVEGMIIRVTSRSEAGWSWGAVSWFAGRGVTVERVLSLNR